MKDRLDSAGLLYFWEKIKSYVASESPVLSVNGQTGEVEISTTSFDFQFNTTEPFSDQVDAALTEAGSYTFSIPYNNVDMPLTYNGWGGIIQLTSTDFRYISVIAWTLGDNTDIYRIKKTNGVWDSSWTKMIAAKDNIDLLVDNIKGLMPFLGTNPISSTTNDVLSNWKNLGQGWAWYNATNCLYGQPGQWGFLLNFVHAEDVWQVFKSQSEGNLYFRSGNGNTTWTASSWKQLANVSDISSFAPVKSVNGYTGAVNTMLADGRPPDTYTAAQCMEFAASHPKIHWVWAKYAAATYTPINVSDYWVYTLYTTYTDSSGYTIFEAANTRTGAVYRCKSDGTWASISGPERILANLSAAVSVPSSTWTTLTSITLPRPGLYLVHGYAEFSNNATGVRQLILTSSTGTSASVRYWNDRRQAVTGGYSTICDFTGMTQLTGTTDATYYLKAWQNSGSALNCTAYCGVDAVRLTRI